MLHRLVYFSRSQLTGAAIEVSLSIRSILEASRRNNSRVGVTGALMFNAGCFAQVLEGPAGAVEQVFDRIGRDERHRGVVLLSSGEAKERVFGSWSMALVGASAANPLRSSPLAVDSAYDPSRMTSEQMVDTLSRLVHEAELSAT